MSANQRMRAMQRISNRMEAYVARHKFNANTFKANKKNAPKIPAYIQSMLKAMGKSAVKKHSKAKSMKPVKSNMNMERPNERKSGRTRRGVNIKIRTKEQEEARLRELAITQAERAARVKAERKAEREAKPVNIDLSRLFDKMTF